MYLELKFKRRQHMMVEGWELYYVNEVEKKEPESPRARIKRVYIEDTSYLEIPDLIEGRPVLAIADWMKLPPFILTLILPDSMAHIPDNAFKNTSIREITIGSVLRNLDFIYNLEKLDRILVSPDNFMFSIHEGNLYQYGGTLLWASNGHILAGTMTIASKAFVNVTANIVYVPDSVTDIEADAFIRCNIEEISISREVTNVDRCFYECTFKILDFRGGGNKTLSFSRAVRNCSIEKLVLPARTIDVPAESFMFKNLKEAVLSGSGYHKESFAGRVEHVNKIALLDLSPEGDYPHFYSHAFDRFAESKARPLIAVFEKGEWMEEVYWQ